VCSGENGLRGTDVGDAGEIHLLMTDVVLPEMSGKDLAREIGKIRPNIKTLFMSGYTANVIAHQGVLDEGVLFMEKPFTFENLGRKVREALGARNAERGTGNG
jgi:two-component system, cell cycle sensor histidine kinase and response regulator CckA